MRLGGKKSFKGGKGIVKAKGFKIKSMKNPVLGLTKSVLKKMPTLKVGKRTTATVNPLRMKLK